MDAAIARKKLLLGVICSLIAAAVIYFFYRFRKEIFTVLEPVFMAAVIAYLMNPLVNALERRNISRSLSILVAYLLFLGLTALLMIYIVPEIINNARELTNTLPDYISFFQNKFQQLLESVQYSRWSEDIRTTINNEIQSITEGIEEAVSRMLRKTVNFAMSLFTFAVHLLLSLFIAYYLLRDIERIKNSVYFLIPHRWRNELYVLANDISEILAKFIQGQLIVALIVGTIETIGLLIIGVKYPLILGLIGGLTNIIPYFGPFIGAVPAVAMGLLDSNPWKGLWAALVFLAVQQLENAFISPRVMERNLGQHPVVTILVILAGGEFFGIIGMILAVPAAAIIRLLFRRIVEKIA